MPETVKSLSPVRQEMLSYSMSLPGRRRPAASHILKTWALTKVQFEEEIVAALSELRSALMVRGFQSANDLEVLP